MTADKSSSRLVATEPPGEHQGRFPRHRHSSGLTHCGEKKYSILAVLNTEQGWGEDALPEDPRGVPVAKNEDSLSPEKSVRLCRDADCFKV